MKRISAVCLLFCLFLSSCSLYRDVTGSGGVRTGLDVAAKQDFAFLEGKRVGLVSNHSALDSRGRHILDIMMASKNVDIRAIFAPEHGFQGTAEEKLQDTIDKKSGLQIFSLYGKSLRPTEEQLRDIDTLVFDIQDIGVRFYTYTGTMAMCMEEAAKNDVAFVVLDRPNPISGLRVAGPIQDRELYQRLTSYFPMPIIHGMTVGELAGMFNDYYGIQCDLGVVKMEGWKRKMYFDETGLPWVNPSPNIRNVSQEILYPAVALTEAWNSNMSVGRGTDTPFELAGAPWIDADRIVNELHSRNLGGVQFTPHHFTPNAGKFKGKECHGFRIEVTDREEFDPLATGLTMLGVLYSLYPETYKIDPNHGLVGSRDVLERIKKGESLDMIRSSYAMELMQFIKIRDKFLLYRQ